MRDLELAISTGAFGMDDPLRNTLAVEVSKQVDQVEVLKQQRAVAAHTLRSL